MSSMFWIRGKYTRQEVSEEGGDTMIAFRKCKEETLKKKSGFPQNI